NKIIALQNPEFVQHYQLTFGAVCGILSLSRGEVKQPRSHQKRKRGDEVGTLEKKCKKPLDKPPKL
ncbi:MAG: hypothetical protein IJZ38_09730, partial [Bacteroides sp.]|nr:hypothetical protein [Bacteroides sp.]